MLRNITPKRLLLTATCLSLTMVTLGCTQSASSNSAPANNQSAQTSDRPATTNPPSNPPQESNQETTIAQADRSEKSQSAPYQPSTPASTALKIPALEKEMSYEQARQLIISAGWQPLNTTTDNPHDGTKSWRDRGYNEVEACSGTGMGFCRFQFTGSGDQKLVVVTGGPGSTLQKWWEEKIDRTDTPAPQASNLPFVGKRFFNFLGGSGTGYTIVIESNGNTVIQRHGTMRSSTVYQGPFQETMEGITIKDGYASTCDQQKSTSEGEPVPCKTKLYE